MPYLSVVVPCYGVQAYVRECLDSILHQHFPDVEVIAIDDASPDHSGEILDEYAAHESRLRVIHLAENVGLGWARNIGLESAAGEYVMFVDSDDWLTPHSLEAIVHRLKDTQPDVLFFDYARAYWSGETRRNVVNHLFREPPAPDVFTLRERPSVMYIWQSAWNKAYRREFLVGLDVRFPKGFYEDIPVSYPVMMAAERISLIDRVCYHYRQNRTGKSILSTRHEGHMAIIDQFDSVFDWMDKVGSEVDWFRSQMLRRAILNELRVFRLKGLLPRAKRREFFERVADQYHRRIPPGFDPNRSHRYIPHEIVPEGREALTFRLVRRRRYRSYIALTWLKRRRAAIRLGWRRLRNGVSASKRKVGQRIRLAKYRGHLRRRLNPYLAIFASDVFRMPAGDPLVIYRKMRELAPHIKGVWVIRHGETERVPSDIPYVIDGSAAYFAALARATYLINNIEFPEFVVKRTGQVYLQTHDGTPLEATGVDLQKYPSVIGDTDLEALLIAADRWDYSLSTNVLSTEVWERAYPCDYQTLESGRPRNDCFFTAGSDEVQEIREGLGIGAEKVAIWYEPTSRAYREDREPIVDLARLVRTLAPDELLMVRGDEEEFLELRALAEAGMFVGISPDVPVEELCLAADVLVTDYSSVVFDYANLARPIVILAHDYEIHREVRGLYVDLLRESPGQVATSEAELREILRDGRYASPESEGRLSAFRRRFCQWDDGKAAERVVRAVFLGQDPGQPLPMDERVPAPVSAPLQKRRAELGRAELPPESS